MTDQLSIFDQHRLMGTDNIEVNTVEKCIKMLKETGHSVITRKTTRGIFISFTTKHCMGSAYCELYNKASIDNAMEMMRTSIYSKINERPRQ